MRQQIEKCWIWEFRRASTASGMKGDSSVVFGEISQKGSGCDGSEASGERPSATGRRAESFKWRLFSSGKPWEGQQGSKSFTCCNKADRTPREFYVIQTSLWDLWEKKDEPSVKPWCFIIWLTCISSQLKAKRYWLTSSTGVLKNALNKSVTVKEFIPEEWMLVTYED